MVFTTKLQVNTSRLGPGALEKRWAPRGAVLPRRGSLDKRWQHLVGHLAAEGLDAVRRLQLARVLTLGHLAAAGGRDATLAGVQPRKVAADGGPPRRAPLPGPRAGFGPYLAPPGGS